MCRYRYHYYTSCHHQKTVLYDFCEDAKPFPRPPLLPAAELQGDQTASAPNPDDKRKGLGAPKASPKTSAPRKPSSHNIGRAPHNPAVSQDYPSELSSVPEEAPSPHRSEKTDDMLALPPFQGGSFRRWVSGRAPATQQSPIDTEPVVVSEDVRAEMDQEAAAYAAGSHVRAREPGIRGTDESYTIHNGDDIIQHITHSSRDLDVPNVDTDDPRMTWYGSASAVSSSEGKTDTDDFASIEAEIDILKEEVARLKDVATQYGTSTGRDQAEPAIVQPPKIEDGLATLSWPKLPSQKPEQESKTEKDLGPPIWPKKNTGKATQNLDTEKKVGPPIWPEIPVQKSEKTSKTGGDFDSTAWPTLMTQKPVLDSPAARLQREHKRLDLEKRAAMAAGPPPPTRLPSPPKPQDFPALIAPKAKGSSSGKVPSENRRPSYASAASGGGKATVKQAHPPIPAKRADSKISFVSSDGTLSLTSPASAQSFDSFTQSSSGFPPSTATSVGHAQPSLEGRTEQRGVVLSPESMTTANGTVFVPNGTPSTENGKLESLSPHFAQPTKAFARRADETLRRGTVSRTVKASPETSPSKSIRVKAPELKTEKRAGQREQKRQSLPEHWMNRSGHPQDGDTPRPAVVLSSNHMPTIASLSSPVLHSSPPELEGSQTVSTAGATGDVGTKNAMATEAPQTPKLRKKTSTYMSPTAAATQRTIATLGETSPKRQAPRVKKAGALRLDTSQANHHHDVSPPASDALNTGSSEGFVNQSSSTIARPSGRSVVAAQTKHAPSKKADKQVAVPGSPTRIPQPAKKGQTPDARNVSFVIHSAGRLPMPLPEIPNTITKRRTSHSELLKPIIDKLESEGLLKYVSEDVDTPPAPRKSGKFAAKRPHSPRKDLKFAIDTDSAPCTESPLGVRGGSSADIGRALAAVPDTDLTASNANCVKSTDFVPPHLRTFAQKATSTVDPLAEAQTPQHPGSVTSGSRTSSQTVLSYRDPAILVKGRVVSESGLLSVPALPVSQKGSLRATAAEFTPLQNPARPQEQPVPPPQQQPPNLSPQQLLDYTSQAQWDTYPEELRAHVRALRAQQGMLSSTYAREAGHTQLRAGIPQNAQSYATLPVAKTPGTLVEMAPIDCVLEPSGGLDEGDDKWWLRTKDGNRVAASFGRASIPPVPVTDEASTLVVSPTSDDTSPIKTPHSYRGWTIGSAIKGRYGWKGGDGKEISFVGWGPDAERDPNSPVNFRDFTNNKTVFHENALVGVTGQRRQEENALPTPPVAPRSMREQWAARMGYPKLPCDDIEVTDAMAFAPIADQGYGFCNDCLPMDH